MDSNNTNKVSAFDTLYSNNQTQMLKIILTYMDKKSQKSMAIYIKFLELFHTIELFKKNPYPMSGCFEEEKKVDISGICSELLPYCTEEQKKHIMQMQNLFQTMEMYQEMSKTMEVMKEFMPDMTNMFSQSTSNGQNENSSDATMGNFDMMSMLMNMLSPEQKEMFQMFNN